MSCDEALRRRRLDRHHREHRRLIGAAQRRLAGGQLALAATHAQIAARFAWLNHTGAFASPELEVVLGEISARRPDPAPSRRGGHTPPVVLHVVTQAYATGGSTRAVECWLEQDSGRRHRLCLTRQGPTPPPRRLLARLDRSQLVRLDGRPGTLLDRAWALRRLAADCDVVLLHTHPYDAVPVIAFAGAEHRPPVINVQHADHVFWLGTSVSDVLMNMRISGRELAIARRGVPAERCILVPRPLLPPADAVSRQEARRRLGVEAGQVVLATVADASKYRPVKAPGFLELVVPTLARHPEAVLLAAGPAPEGEWLEAIGRSRGRIRALGRLPDAWLVHAAADLYLDSYPFSSLTSLLEAGCCGVPAISYRGHPAGCGVLGADTPVVDQHILRPADPGAFEQALERAIVDADWRGQSGEALREAILETHTGVGWRAAADRMYTLAAGVGPASPPGPAPRELGPLDQLVDAVMERTGFSQGCRGAIRDHLGLLPAPRRARALIELAAQGVTPRPREALPEWVLPWLAAARRRVTGRAKSPAEAPNATAGPRRALLVCENASVPGDRRVWNESRSLHAAGWEVVVVCPRGNGRDTAAFERREGIEIHRFPLTPASGGAAAYLREYAVALWRIRRLVRRLARTRSFDVVHVANPPDLLLLAVRSLRARGAALVFDHHDLVPELYRSRFADGSAWLYRLAVGLEWLAFRLADVVISTNDSYRQVALTRGGRAPEDVFVVRNGPDMRRFQPLPPDPSLRRGQRHLIAYLGIMGPQDGVDHAIRALAWLAAQRSDWHAILIGEGDALEDMRALARELGLAERVEFAGWRDDQDIRTILCTADVCLAPDPPSPLNDVSTMIKVVEYLAMGAAVVSYPLAESRISAGNAAVYARAGDPCSLGRCVHELLDDPAERRRLGVLGRRRVEQQLSWQRSEQALHTAYARALARAAVRRTAAAPAPAMRPRPTAAGEMSG